MIDRANTKVNHSSFVSIINLQIAKRYRSIANINIIIYIISIFDFFILKNNRKIKKISLHEKIPLEFFVSQKYFAFPRGDKDKLYQQNKKKLWNNCY